MSPSDDNNDWSNSRKFKNCRASKWVKSEPHQIKSNLFGNRISAELTDDKTGVAPNVEAQNSIASREMSHAVNSAEGNAVFNTRRTRPKPQPKSRIFRTVDLFAANMADLTQ